MSSLLKHIIPILRTPIQLVVAQRKLTLAMLCIAFVFCGCDWRSPDPSRSNPRGLNLSGDNQLSSWHTRPGDRDLIPALRTSSTDSLWIEIESRQGLPSRWRRKVRWPIHEFPMLSWEWLIQQRVDSLAFPRKRVPEPVLSVDVTLASTFGFHKTIRYIWSARKDSGAVYDDRDNWHPKMIVLRDASDSVGVIRKETVDVWKDFQSIWKVQPRQMALAIGITCHSPDKKHPLVAQIGTIDALPKKETP